MRDALAHIAPQAGRACYGHRVHGRGWNSWRWPGCRNELRRSTISRASRPRARATRRRAAKAAWSGIAGEAANQSCCCTAAPAAGRIGRAIFACWSIRGARFSPVICRAAGNPIDRPSAKMATRCRHGWRKAFARSGSKNSISSAFPSAPWSAVFMPRAIRPACASSFSSARRRSAKNPARRSR